MSFLFIQIAIKQPGHSIIAIGDLHGSITSLIANIYSLYEKQIVDADGKLKEGHTLIFLGDYTDRAENGPAVWYTLARLQRINPHNVFLVRGNHETMEMAWAHDFWTQWDTTFAQTMGHQAKEAALSQLFNALPHAVFIGAHDRNKDHFNFLMFCHGGIDPHSNFSEQIVRTIQEFKKTSDTLPAPYPIDSSCSPDSALLWWDFHANTEHQERASTTDSSRGPGTKSCNSSAAWDFIKKHRSDDPEHLFTLRAIIRGHQHIPGGISRLRNIVLNKCPRDEDPNFERLVPQKRDLLEHPTVICQNSSPEGLYAIGCLEDAYSLIESAPQGWFLTPCVKRRVPQDTLT